MPTALTGYPVRSRPHEIKESRSLSTLVVLPAWIRIRTSASTTASELHGHVSESIVPTSTMCPALSYLRETRCLKQRWWKLQARSRSSLKIVPSANPFRTTYPIITYKEVTGRDEQTKGVIKLDFVQGHSGGAKGEKVSRSVSALQSVRTLQIRMPDPVSPHASNRSNHHQPGI